MPKLFTNAERRPNLPNSIVSTSFCVSTYEEYVNQRVVVEDVDNEKIQLLTKEFKDRISTPVHQLSPEIEMGEYFVIPVSELRQMLDSGDNAEFLHICNALRKTQNSAGQIRIFPVTIIVPLARKTVEIDGETETRYDVCASQKTIFLEAYPCPPHPKCPTNDPDDDRPLTEVSLFEEGFQFNDFKALK